MPDFLSAMFTLGVPVAEKVLRVAIVYVFFLVGLRLLGKREMGQWNPVDLIVLLLLSETVESAVVGEDHSVTGGLIGASTLFLLNHLTIRLTHRHHKSRRAIDGTPDDLMKDGHIVPEALDRNQVTREEMAAAARRHGIENLAHVRLARLELDGDITFLKKEEHDAEAIVRRIEERLARIEARLPVAAPQPRGG